MRTAATILREPTSFISGLTEDEQIDVIAPACLGRDDHAIEDWDALCEEASGYAALAPGMPPGCLFGMPLLSDYRHQGLSQLGEACDEFESGRF